MNYIRIRTVAIVLVLLCVTHIASASFTGSSDRKSRNIFSLKNFNKNFYKTASPFSLRAGVSFKGFQVLNQKKEAGGDVFVTSMMRYEKGNTTYIYPYKHTIVVPKFKTPVAPEFR